jgi:PAS domain S-box-containing protein
MAKGRSAGLRRSAPDPSLTPALLDFAGEGLVAVDGDARVIWCNRPALDLFGYRRAPSGRVALGRFVTEVPAVDNDPDAARLWLRGAARRDMPFRAAVRRRDGMSSALDMRVREVAAGGDCRFLVALREGAHECRMQEELQAVRTYFQRIVDTAAEAIVSADDNGRIILFNPAAERLFGYAAAEIVGQPIETLMPAQYRAHHAKHVAEFAASPSSTRMMGERGRITGLRRDGTEFPAAASISRFAVGNRLVFNVVLRDISETAAIEQALQAAREDAERGSRAKAAFLANMSHELRTPLNAIIGFSEVIAKEVLGSVAPGRYREYAADIFESGRHLLDVINNILDMSKIEAGREELVEEDIDVAAIVDTCLRIVAGIAREGGVTVRSSVDSAGWCLRADSLKLRKILINLLSNAVKFTPSGGTVSVAASCSAKAGIGISVSDTGIGMAPQDIPKALAPFEQVEESLDRRYSGTGLGLPLAKALVELHGGELRISSIRHEGTVVTVLFRPERVRMPAAL